MAIVQAQYETLLDVTFTGTPVLAYYAVGDTVWRKSEFDGALASWTGGRSYTIQRIILKSFDDSGTERFADSTGDTEVSNAGTQPGDTTTGWWYVIASPNALDTEYTVHESDLLDESAMETYAATQLATFIG